nr:heme exporter protein CcmD [Actinomycetota bacterium]
MKRFVWLSFALCLLAVIGTAGASAAKQRRAAGHPPTHMQRYTGTPTAREFAESRGRNFGDYVTECPQAKWAGTERPLQRIDRDRVWNLSERGDDIRFNYDLACVPQNETSIAVNPRNTKNLVGGANDYQGDLNQFDATSSRGKGVYGSTNLAPSNPFGYALTQSDPVFVYDRDGIAYNQEIAFAFDDSNGVFVWRSTNGGFTWSRPCVPFEGDPDRDDAVCGGVGDPRQPADGVITWNQDPTPGTFNGDAPFDDKNWMAIGPRPAGVAPQCFAPVTRTPRACDPDQIGSDRIHATWTRFHTSGCDEEGEFEAPCEGRIWHSYSDDQARSWSPAKPISGTAAFCSGIGPLGPNNCDDNQFSVPTVHPKTGLLGVAFENFNTADENQYLFVRSRDGGSTFEGPFFVSPVFDVNYPRGATRPDCRARGQSGGREVLTNSCFRVNSGGAVVVDKRNGAFADDFYLVLSDNRNGTQASSNTDVLFFRSTDGGATWIGPTRVNDDRSVAPPDRDEPTMGNYGNVQWFPWIDINADGVLAVAFYDRRLDEDSTAHA